MAQSKTSLRSSMKSAVDGRDRDVLGKYNYGNGAGWCNKRNRKINNRAKGETPGKTKGGTCIATQLDKYMAKSSRSYKHKDYPSWCAKVNAIPGNRPMGRN